MNNRLKKPVLAACALLAAFPLLTGTPSGADPHYNRHRSERYNYEIIVPARWQTDELTLEKKHIFLSYSGDSEIKVRAFISDDPDIGRTIRKRSWNLRAIDPLLNKIIETEKITIRKNVSGKLLVFEYRSRNRKILQRTMITRNDATIYIVDCKGPVRSFYRNEESFNIALSSFKFLSGEAHAETGMDTGKADDKIDDGLDELDSAPSKSRPDNNRTNKKDSASEEHFFDLE
jgi:hypothetical protein